MPILAVSLRCRVAWVTKPIGIVVEDEIAASSLVVNRTLWVAIIAVNISFGTALKGFLTDDCRCAAENVEGVAEKTVALISKSTMVLPQLLVMTSMSNIPSAYKPLVEVIDAFDCRVIEIERLDVTDDLIVYTLFIPSVIAERC